MAIHSAPVSDEPVLRLLGDHPAQRPTRRLDTGDRGAPIYAQTHGATRVGHRDRNEDQFLIAELERSLSVRDCSLPDAKGVTLLGEPQGLLVAVADGVGGMPGGRLASAVAIDTLAQHAFCYLPWVLARRWSDRAVIGAQFNAAVRESQNRMRSLAKQRGVDPRLATTLTAAYVVWPNLIIIHAGDSRAYLSRQGRLERITVDHTIGQQMLENDLIEDTSDINPRISATLGNAIGGKDDDVRVDLMSAELQPDDRLLLCTDGLTGALSDDEISVRIADSPPVDVIVDQLVDAALYKGSRDNVTAVMARF
jgi:protein phosphatase